MSKFFLLISLSVLFFQNSFSKMMPFRAEDSSKRKVTQTKKQTERKEQPWYQRIPVVRTLTTPKKTIRTMSYEELKASKDRVLEEGRPDVAIKYYEKMIPQCADLNEKSDILLEVGDLLFDAGNLPKAELYYGQFVLLYPGNKRIWYALNRSILCCYYQIGTVDRDQSKTEQTLELINKFLTRVDKSDPERIAEEVQKYTKEVLKVQKDCRLKLCEHELYITDFYIKSGKYTSAQKRIKGVRKNWLPKVPEIEYSLLQRELAFAQKQDNTQLVEKTQNEITDKFPQLAQNKEDAKKHSSDRF